MEMLLTFAIVFAVLLVVVIAILGVLAAITVPMVNNSLGSSKD